jgi:AcrR family transcriptional regulator
MKPSAKPSDTPMTSRGEQAKQALIDAAITLFGERGLEGATTRDIALKAGQNIAAITYYFQSKEGLYLAVARWISDFISQAFAPLQQECSLFLLQKDPKPDAYLAFIHRGLAIFCHLMTQPETLHLSQIMSREQLAPTAVYPLIHQQCIAPLHRLMTQLVAGYSGLPADSAVTTLHTHALLGEVLAFRMARETIRIQAGWESIGPEQADLINQVLQQHIDLLLNGLRMTYSSTAQSTTDGMSDE